MPQKKRTGKPKHDIAQLEADYGTLWPLLHQLEGELQHQLSQLLARATVFLGFPIQHRVKTWSSIVGKLQRVPLCLSTLRDMQDLVGFRIVLQFRRDVDRVCKLLEQNLKIIDHYDTRERLREDQFGYASVHFVVELPDAWLALPTMAGLTGVRAEIQVRTTAQHIWAEASNTLQYKRKESVPPTLQRAIYRVSALLETVDLEFERVLVDRDAYLARAATLAASGTETLNVDNVGQILDASWPVSNKELGEEDYADLLTDLRALNVATADALRKLIGKWREYALKEDAQRVSDLHENPDAVDPFSERERVDSGVFFTHCGLTRIALQQEFPDRWAEYMDSRTRRLRTVRRG